MYLKHVSSSLLLFGLSAFFVCNAESAYAYVRLNCSIDDKYITTLEMEGDCGSCFPTEKREELLSKLDNIQNAFGCPSKYVDVTIYGKINYADSIFLTFIYDLFYDKNTNKPTSFGSIWKVRLDSEGGYVEPAINISNIFSKYGARVGVSNKCYSSCVLILAGGRYRYIGGEVGVHNISVSQLPSDVPNNPTSINRYFATTYEKIENLFERNRVSTSVLALMKSTSSLRIRKLSRDELNSYGLRMLNTAYEESLRYKVSQKWGEEGVRKLAEAIAISDACDQDFTDNCPSDLDGLFKVIELIESK